MALFGVIRSARSNTKTLIGRREIHCRFLKLEGMEEKCVEDTIHVAKETSNQPARIILMDSRNRRPEVRLPSSHMTSSEDRLSLSSLDTETRGRHYNAIKKNDVDKVCNDPEERGYKIVIKNLEDPSSISMDPQPMHETDETLFTNHPETKFLTLRSCIKFSLKNS